MPRPGVSKKMKFKFHNFKSKNKILEKPFKIIKVIIKIPY